jgi:Tol biopolymer transport system component/predicted Ser/Thr protein kinase
MVGTTLGHYRIVRLLGRGGMGDVYAAEDARLNRLVALKILSQITPDDTERLERFRREAQAIAALKHPNVVTIYSVEEVDSAPFLTMELVEGKSLAELMMPHGMKLGQVLDLASQLADAIAAAHQHGIVHRDLKPSNVMVGDDGRLKVLDFGIAKLKQKTRNGGDFTTYELTAEHAVIGTASYMSPEQAEGRPVDHRADIFSFGIVLYEMATGTRPFKGESTTSILSAILKDVPAPAASLNPGVPGELDRVIRRCLAKDPAHRYQDAIDLRNDLKDLADTLPTERRRTSAGRRAAYAFAAIAAVAAAVAAWALFRQAGERPAPVATFSKLTTLPGREWFPSLSPNGSWLVFSAEVEGNFDIFLQSVTGSNPLNLTKDSPDDDEMPAFSPDGGQIAFRSSRGGGGIFVMGRTGEGVRRVTRNGFNPSWSPDGTEIVFSSVRMDIYPQNVEGGSQLWIVAATGGQPRLLHDGDAIQPTWSPHGSRVAFAKRGTRTTDIWTIPSAGGEPTRVMEDSPIDWNPVWDPDGTHLYFVSNRSGTMNLWRVALDEESGRARGEPEPIVTPASFVAHPTIAGDGRTLAFTSVLLMTNIQKLGFDPSSATPVGDPQWVTTGSRLWANPDPSPDGQFVVYYSRVEPEGHLYVSRADGTGQRQLTGDAAIDRVPHWSPDGAWISFFSTRSGEYQIWRIRPDGSDLQQVTDPPNGSGYSTWSPDGSRLALESFIVDPGRGWNQQPLEKLPPVPGSQYPLSPNSWSPDGQRLIGFTGPTSPSLGLVMYTFRTRTYERLTDFGEWPVWLPDSRRVLFGDGGKHFWVLDTLTRQAKIVYSGGRDVLGPPRLTADGRVAFYSRRVTEADVYLMSLR